MLKELKKNIPPNLPACKLIAYWHRKQTNYKFFNIPVHEVDAVSWHQNKLLFDVPESQICL